MTNMKAATPPSTTNSSSFSVIGDRYVIHDKRLIHLSPGGTAMVRQLGGRRLVATLYVVVVAIAGVMGFVIGSISPRGLDPEFLGVVDFPPTPLGMAAYGALTLAVLLGVLLLVVMYVTRFDDDAV